MKFTRAMLAFVTVPFLWAVLAFALGRRLVLSGDLALLTAMSFVAGMVWLGFVNMSVAALRKGKPSAAIPYIATAVIGSGVSALVADLVHSGDVPAALELSGGVVALAAVSSLLFVVIAGLPWHVK